MTQHRITIFVPEEKYDLVSEFLATNGIEVPPPARLDPGRDAGLIAALDASEKQAREHPETCLEWDDLLKEWDAEELAANNPAL